MTPANNNGVKKYEKAEEEYIIRAREIIEEIITVMSRNPNEPTAKEWEVSKMIAEKMIDPFYYWLQGRERKATESAEEDLNRAIERIAQEYDLDLNEINKNQSRVRTKRYIGEGFEPFPRR
jgi:hypothetical protein